MIGFTLASVVAILTIALKEKLDRKTGALLVILYSISYTLLYLI